MRLTVFAEGEKNTEKSIFPLAKYTVNGIMIVEVKEGQNPNRKDRTMTNTIYSDDTRTVEACDDGRITIRSAKGSKTVSQAVFEGEPSPADVDDCRRSGVDPNEYCATFGMILPRAMYDAVAKWVAQKNRRAASDLAANVPGLDELTAAWRAHFNAVQHRQDAMRRMMDTGSSVLEEMPDIESLERTIERLQAQYPRAAAYVSARAIANRATGSIICFAAQAQMEALAAGEPMDVVQRIKDQAVADCQWD
jgi:hypothetical protein